MAFIIGLDGTMNFVIFDSNLCFTITSHFPCRVNWWCTCICMHSFFCILVCFLFYFMSLATLHLIIVML